MLTVLHGIQVVDLDGDGRDEVLTASFEGIHRFDFKGQDMWIMRYRSTKGRGPTNAASRVGNLNKSAMILTRCACAESVPRPTAKRRLLRENRGYLCQAEWLFDLLRRGPMLQGAVT